jgi:hypothetical protein
LWTIYNEVMKEFGNLVMFGGRCIYLVNIAVQFYNSILDTWEIGWSWILRAIWAFSRYLFRVC